MQLEKYKMISSPFIEMNCKERMLERFSVPPSESDIQGFIQKKAETFVVRGLGFVLKVKKINIFREEICNITGNIICEAKIEADFFMPEIGNTYEAIVEMSRNGSVLALIEGKFRVFFYSVDDMPKGARVKLLLKKLSFQNKTYRGVASL